MLGHSSHAQGFTLIELSIVLVIIGLIVGGVLVGQDLIRAAGVRAQISQIEKFNSAVNTFRGKYGYLPGDIKDPDASSFGFQARGQYAGQGDGNGILEGVYGNGAGFNNGVQQPGENAVFWVDLSTAKLIEGGFSSLAPNQMFNAWTPAMLDPIFPHGKIGGTNYVYTYSTNGANFFGVSAISSVGPNCTGCIASVPAITVQQAYSIDLKMDDGLPQSGRVTAVYLNTIFNGNLTTWSAGGGGTGAASGANGPTTAATVGSSTTCYDNSASGSGTPGVAGAAQHYSLEISSGANVNCALSFQFQ